MKNRDMPAAPMFNEHGCPQHHSSVLVQEGQVTGLTKRELIAAVALQGMGTWVPSADHGPFNWDSPEAVCALKARWAVAQADALLEELERRP